MAQIREIKKRMVAVKNIQRITKTMQMIATARFTAALQRTQATQPYTRQIRKMVGEVAAAAGEISHPLIDGADQPANRELMLVITSDRGLCGAYNSNVLRTALRHYRTVAGDDREIVVHAAGKKAGAFFRFQGIAVSDQFSFGDKPAYDDVERLARRYIDAFVAGEYDNVHVVYMRFESNARQVPEVMQLMPLRTVAGGGDTSGDAEQNQQAATANYEFSPSAEELLADLLPLTVKTSLFQAFNDAAVSEQIMRMIAMKAATENAGDLRRSLSRQYNRARQAQITTELMEVISGSAALE